MLVYAGVPSWCGAPRGARKFYDGFAVDHSAISPRLCTLTGLAVDHSAIPPGIATLAGFAVALGHLAYRLMAFSPGLSAART